MKPKLFLLFIIYNLSFCIVATATIRYVSKTGSSTPPYTSWATASDSIQKCINVCQSGDTIYVGNGVYKEKVTMIKGLSLIGCGMDSCIISLEFISTAVTLADSCILEGFNIIVPDTLNTRGVEVNFNGVGSRVTFCKINNASNGIYVRNNDTKVYKNVFVKIKSTGIYLFNSNSITRLNYVYTDPNYEIPSYAIYIEAFNNNYTPTIDSNYIETQREGIRKSFGSRPIIANNTIIMKNASSGIFLSISDSARVYNNLLIFSNAGIGIENNGTPHLQLNNNFLTGKFYDHPDMWAIDTGPNNKVKQNVIVGAKRGIYAGATQNLVVQYNNLWNTDIKYSGFSADTTNISVDPMIVNGDSLQGELDFHLQKYSPLIDAGDPTILDRDGSRSDIGLYGGPYGWTYTYMDLAPRPPHNVTAVNSNGLIKLTWNKNTEADFSHYRIYRDTVSILIYDSTRIVGVTADTVFYDNLPISNSVKRYYYLITAFDNQGNQSAPSEEAIVTITGLSEHPPIGFDDYILLSNYPNPFNPSTKIPYRLKESGYVKLCIYDVKGELVKVLVNEWQDKGYHEVIFQPTIKERVYASGLEVKMGKNYNHVASGFYIYMIQVKNENNVPVFSDLGKMMLLK